MYLSDIVLSISCHSLNAHMHTQAHTAHVCVWLDLFHLQFSKELGLLAFCSTKHLNTKVRMRLSTLQLAVSCLMKG